MPPLLVGVGRAAVEVVGVAQPGERDARQELLEITVQGGGAVANALAAAALLGVRARLAARLADDEFGRLVQRGLRDLGVDTNHVRLAGTLSPFSFRTIAERGRRGPSWFTTGDVGPLDAGDLDLAPLLDSASALLLSTDGGARDAGALIAAAEAASDRKVPVILDAGELAEGTGELVGLADYLICSERFASEIAPRGEVEDSLVELLKLGPEGAVITLGDAGSVGLFGDRLVKQPAFDVEARDTMGAGEVYHGGFSAALVLGHPPEKCMEIASAAAALKCRALGARGGLGDMQELRAFLGWGPE